MPSTVGERKLLARKGSLKAAVSLKATANGLTRAITKKVTVKPATKKKRH